MNPIDDTRCFPDDVLPPEGEFGSREELAMAINAWAAPRGYAFAVKSSWKTPNGRTGVIFNCDRGAGRAPSSSKARQRRTGTRRTGCLFSVIAKESLCKTIWSLRHRPGADFNHHNHEPSLTQVAHPIHRQLSCSDESTVHQLANAGVAPKDIRSYLQMNSDTLATQQDIYNCIKRGKRDLARGQSNIHALADQLKSEGFWSQIRIDKSNRVVAVFFAHPKSLGYLKSYPEVLILDCTYKTNMYKMPLLDIVGVDACQRSFCIAFAFLSGEEEADFIWALGQLRYLYELHSIALPTVILTDRCLACMNALSSLSCFPESPSLLCLWHINKAVLSYCMPAFTRDKGNPQGHEEWKAFYGSWHEIVASTTEDIYNERLEKFKERYLPEYLNEVGYILETWLDLYKERFVKAWVQQHLHFEQFVTSRAEGIHQLIKSHLKTSQTDLFEAWRIIRLVISNQVAELEANQVKQQTTTPVELSGVLYGNIRGWISREALRKVEVQRKRLLGELPACTGVFTKTLSLPCAHALQPLLEQKQPLQLHHFHSHWHLQRSGTPQLIIEPHKQFDRLAANSTLPPTSTQREPSLFELVEKAAQPKAPPKCSRCHEHGHNMRSKACPLRYEHLLPAPTQTSTTTHTTTHISTRSVTRSLSPSSPSGASIVSETITTTHTTTYTTTQVLSPPTATPSTTIPAATATAAPTLRADDPRAIFQRYKEAREAWYATLPQGAYKTNQQYRKAMRLPIRYSKAEYDWCLDYKQMGRHCKAGSSIRDWTKEEMMSYLDWDKAENERVEQNVGIEMAEQPFSGRRGMRDIWDAAERDLEVQERWYGNGNPPN
ncbi:hypothetical protein MRS44_013862 [Fusarium solani]|uniref:uncharacterized protein n=1 Tax=Fusarium solani TaxID=169388 RepID=UPI0032C44322|nr:hypothetical protein MRS44_013862 [Fusarium solani]